MIVLFHERNNQPNTPISHWVKYTLPIHSFIEQTRQSVLPYRDFPVAQVIHVTCHFVSYIIILIILTSNFCLHEKRSPLRLRYTALASYLLFSLNSSSDALCGGAGSWLACMLGFLMLFCLRIAQLMGASVVLVVVVSWRRKRAHGGDHTRVRIGEYAFDDQAQPLQRDRHLCFALQKSRHHHRQR